MSPVPGSVIAGKFRLERPLAQGGMGSVWVAHNLQLDVPVALKFMAQAFAGSAELVARFEREAKAAAQLRHPNVVQVFEHGVADGLPYIAMELLEGESLGQRLKARRTLPLVETSRIVGDVCLALRRAHERGLVHRDLKPANIFLCRHDDLETIKVLDFGIVKSLSASAEEEITKSGAIFGSPHYMSPEQARRTSKPVDHRTDLWALGVIAFRCLTGALPFPGNDAIDVLVRMCTDAAPLASSIAPGLGPEVDRFFLRALARDPDDRFQSAKQLADALAALAAQSARASIPSLESWSPATPSPLPPAAPRPPFAAATPLPVAPNAPHSYSAAVPGPTAHAASPAVGSAAPQPAAAPPPLAHAAPPPLAHAAPSPLAHAAPQPGAHAAAQPPAPQDPSCATAGQIADASRSVAPAVTHVEATAPGTLTDAGTLVRPAGRTTRPKAWTIPVMVGAALALVVGVVVTTLAGDGEDTSTDGAHSTGTAAAASPSASTESIPAVTPGQSIPPEPTAAAAVSPEPTALPEPATSALVPEASPGVAAAAAAAPQATSRPGAVRTASAATLPVPTSPATAKTAGTAPTSRPVATPPPSAVPAASAAGTAGGSGYLSKPKF